MLSDFHIEVAADPEPLKTQVCAASLRKFGWAPVVSIPPQRRFELVRARTTGFSLYCDGDFVFLDDPKILFFLAETYRSKAIFCVQHPPYDAPAKKIQGRPNEWYQRKNWSSLMVINHEHPANTQLQLDEWDMPALHRFRWLDDSQIGSLNARWNVLVGAQQHAAPGALHFTHGVPGEACHIPTEYDDFWLDAVRSL